VRYLANRCTTKSRSPTQASTSAFHEQIADRTFVSAPGAVGGGHAPGGVAA
jgi:hypothetical protein